MTESGVKHVVGFSGGIDSQATALWVREHFPAEDVILLNSDVGGHEHPITSEFIGWYSLNIFPVSTVTPLVKDMGGRGTVEGREAWKQRQKFSDDDVLTFPRLALIKGRFPARMLQFCTEHLKLRPQRRWCEENLEVNGWDWERYTGVRRQEGERGEKSLPVDFDWSQVPTDGTRHRHKVFRSRLYTPDREWDTFFNCWINYPLAAWTKQQCFDYVQSRGERVNPLYTMGFGRVGCAPCVNSNKEDIREWATRFPLTIDKVRDYEQETNCTFFPPCVPGLEINWIDQVVAWAMQPRGGRINQLQMLADEPVLTCSSKYGLCE